ncbi:hypothetical protein R3P38DRAFT_2842519, partial [Favolaschia claudopus]
TSARAPQETAPFWCVVSTCDQHVLVESLPPIDMMPLHSDLASLQGLQRSDKYYINGGDFYCITENRMFRVHRYFFERESRFFREQLAIPATPGALRLGSSEDSAVILDGVKSADFDRLLWVFYNPKYSLYNASVDDWSVILSLADRWSFLEVKNLAVRELEKLEMLDVDRIVLYHNFHVDESFCVPRYVALCERPELLTVDEGLRLGMETVIPLTRARECLRNGAASSGLRSPSPSSVSQTELTEIIKEHFGIKPDVIKPEQASAGGWVTLSFAGRALIDELQQPRVSSSSSSSNNSHHRHRRSHRFQRSPLTSPPKSPLGGPPTNLGRRSPTTQQSPMSRVPPPGPRHLEHPAGGKTAPAPIEKIRKMVERAAEEAEQTVHEEADVGGKDDGDSGYESGAAKVDFEDSHSDGHHESTSCGEVAANDHRGQDCVQVTAAAAGDAAEDTEQLAINVAKDGEQTATSSDSTLSRGKPKLTVEVPAGFPSLLQASAVTAAIGEAMIGAGQHVESTVEGPAIPGFEGSDQAQSKQSSEVDVPLPASEDEGGEQFFDSREAPAEFDPFSVS